MPRKTRRDDQPPTRRRDQKAARARPVEEIAESLTGPGWARTAGYMVRSSRVGKEYRCPYCSGRIAPSTTHIVAYPEGELESRRHYHRGCWSKFSSKL